jgi:TolA-binding protein
MKTMPELFEDAIVSAKDGSVQLSRAIVNEVAKAAGEEVAITRESAIAKLQTRIEETNASIDAIRHVRDLSKQYSGETLTVEKINANLTKAEKIAAAKAMVAARIQ